MMPVVAPRIVSRAWCSSPVTCRRSLSSANSRTLMPRRPRSRAPATRSSRRGSRRRIGSSITSSSVMVRRTASGVSCSARYALAKAQASVTMSKPGATWARPASRVPRARNTPATSGGIARPYAETTLNRSVNMRASGAMPAPRWRPMHWPRDRSRRFSSISSGRPTTSSSASVSAAGSPWSTARSKRCSAPRSAMSSRSTEPKSRRPSRPSVSSKTLPGCGSAWKTPPSTTCRSTHRSSVRASWMRSRPRATITGSAADSGVPCSRSMTSIRAVHKPLCGTG